MTEQSPKFSILIVEDDEAIRGLVMRILTGAGYEVIEASNGRQGLQYISEAMPNLIISDIMMPELDGLELLRQLRANATTAAIPLILLTALRGKETLVHGLDLGADDYLVKPFEINELLARVRAKLARPPAPAEMLPLDRPSGALSSAAFRQETARELARARRGGTAGVLACLELIELERLHERLGTRSSDQIARQVVQLALDGAHPLTLIGREKHGRFALLLPEASTSTAQRQLAQIANRIANHVFQAGSEHLRLTPSIGFASLESATNVDDLHRQALVALERAGEHLDLQPLRYGPEHDAYTHAHSSGLARLWQRTYAALALPIQLVLVFTLFLVVPLVAYTLLAASGHDITPQAYIVVVIALLITATLIWVEGFLALVAPPPPPEPAGPKPPASAIIAAYLPNEAATIVETVEAFLRQEYPGPLQIILAYNTPRDLPVEAALTAIARRDWRFLPLRIHDSTSKAQNVNAALAYINGEFVGIFDADHHPQPDSFMRAWRWLAHDYDIVQGHCLVRNGGESWVARAVAVEFEAIYAVSHPGRAQLHKFGIFGGSNGYWRASLLRQTRLHGFMLTEDIDSSIRVIEAGYRIASDPLLISRELATTTLKAFFNQRLRWSQGWFQVSIRHAWRATLSPKLSLRQKFGVIQLLVWREIYPWISFQMVPILIFLAWRYGGLTQLDWFIPIFVLTTLFTQSVAIGQVLFTYRLAAPEIRQQRGWFVYFLLISFCFFTPLKNLIAMLAQIKEFMRERQWKVTPRG